MSYENGISLIEARRILVLAKALLRTERERLIQLDTEKPYVLPDTDVIVDPPTTMLECLKMLKELHAQINSVRMEIVGKALINNVEGREFITIARELTLIEGSAL